MERREIIDFHQVNTGVKTKRTGVKVGKHLVVATTTRHDENTAQIFGIISGRPVIDVRFPYTVEGIKEAIEVAKWLDGIYQDYFDLWEVYPDWNIVSISRWTVDQGIQVWLACSKLERFQDTITLSDLQAAWLASQSEVPNYTRFFRPR